MTSSGPAAVCIDWGTSSFRAYLVKPDGTILERSESARGILTVARGEHEALLAGIIGGWLSGGAPRIVMSGMIGSRQGWLEAPYAPCPAGLQEIAAAMEKASQTYLKGILETTKDEVVSSDFIHSQASSIFDEGSGIELNKRFFKLVSWYDNEWGYSNRVADLLKYIIKRGL